MDKERIQSLVDRFNKGDLDEDGLRELELLLEEGVVDIQEFPALAGLYERLETITAEPGQGMDAAFYSMLKEAGKGEGAVTGFFGKWFKGKGFTGLISPSMQVALASLLLLIGFGLGTALNISMNRKEFNRITEELNRMQHTAMLTLLERSSASDRLKAISLSGNFNEADERLIEALLQTLNQDPNVNVRLAAIEALVKYAGNEKVRLGLIASIPVQDRPIVQVALADAMLLIQEKRSIGPFKELIEREGTDVAVRNKLEKTIQQLI